MDNSKDRKFKINADMMNLLGCTKENFYKLMLYMDYKKDKTDDTYIFKGDKKKSSKGIYGDASLDQINELKDEGIETEVIPWINDNEN